MLRQIARDHFLGTLIRCGIFRHLVCDVRNKKSLISLQAKVSLNDQLNQLLSSTPRIISKWFDLIKNEFTDTPATHYAVEKGEVYSESDVILPEQITRKFSQPIPVHPAYEAALSQIERIVGLFAIGKDQPARLILDQLVTENLQCKGGEVLAVKSLCNVAKKVASRGREDISSQCLSEALKYPTGIDHVLYFQIATDLRDICRFDDAIQCYEKAEKQVGINDQSREKIRVAKIHILTIKGEYDKALNEYHAINDFNLKPSVLCSIADLYRKLGRYKESRDYYHTCLNLAPETHRAVAGLAEVCKQKGKFHKAIQIYNKIMHDFKELDEESIFIYELARASFPIGSSV